MRLLIVPLLSVAVAWSLTPAKPKIDANNIIQKSVAANDKVFKIAPDFNYTQREKTSGQVKTSRVTMIEGSPYERLIAINGKPLNADQAAAEEKKQQDAILKRKSESPSARKDRIDKFEKERSRDHMMMSQLTQAFDFTFLATRKVRGFNVWAFKAVPKPGYKPPSMDCQVLPGMEGEMWIDQKSYHWVKVMAKVIHPVSIEGFLAQVQPGTRFEIEESPVHGDLWQITHYSSYADARVLYLFNHQQNDDVTYSNYQLLKPIPR